MTNPLEIYEIIHRVGQFVPCWMPNNKRHHNRLYFHPRDLIACIMVCRLWRTSLTPLLWLVYDERQMSIGWRIPTEVLRAHNSHFRLSSFLNNNPGLQDIRLRDPLYISGFKGCRPLVNLTRLELYDVDWEGNPGLLELISLVPNLTALNFVHRGDSSSIMTELCATLRENCPKLDWIRYRNANSRIGCALRAEHIIPWIQASPRLVHFDTLASTFTTSIYWTLICHASWIDTLCLKFLKGVEENARNTSKILGHCTHLRSLNVIHASTISKLSLEWFEEPWRTDNIESLCLQGFTDPLKRNSQYLNNIVGVGEKEGKKVEDLH
ncbi:MAG: hypothetical protein BYD32DRAFT_452065 [Podila humilis]|nr:MAG: hypothetical protein BYD32DRAFT_452065 [Podila humilis]